MNLTESDIATIHALLTDYQWYVDHAHELHGFPFMIIGTREKDALLRPYSEVRDRIANTAPLLTKVLSMEIPAGFTLLKTIDEQCCAWNSHVTLGLHGPVSEFQARLWCWQNEQVNEEIKINIIEDEDGEEVIELEVDEACGDITGFLGNVGEGGHGGVLNQAVIERTFNKEMWGTW